MYAINITYLICTCRIYKELGIGLLQLQSNSNCIVVVQSILQGLLLERTIRPALLIHSTI
jgi:hypothetical protein